MNFVLSAQQLESVDLIITKKGMSVCRLCGVGAHFFYSLDFNAHTHTHKRAEQVSLPTDGTGQLLNFFLLFLLISQPLAQYIFLFVSLFFYKAIIMSDVQRSMLRERVYIYTCRAVTLQVLHSLVYVN